MPEIIGVDDSKEALFVVGPLLMLILVSASLFVAVVYDIVAGSTASVAATLLLVVITGFYVMTTYATLGETRKAREQEMRPFFSFRPEEFGSTVVNIGNGPARRLELTLRLEPAGKSHYIERRTLPEGAKVEINEEPFSSIADRIYDDLQLQAADVDWNEYDEETFWEEFDDEPYEELILDGTCEDVWGNEREIQEKYEVRDLTREFVGSTDATMDREESLQLLALEIQKIRSMAEDWDREE